MDGLCNLLRFIRATKGYVRKFDRDKLKSLAIKRYKYNTRFPFIACNF